MTYVRLATGNKWRREQTTDNAVVDFAIKLKNFPINKVMVHVTGDKGILRKSVDSGVTWTNVTLPAGTDACVDVVEAHDGSIWGLFLEFGEGEFFGAKVNKSTNAMGTWSAALYVDPDGMHQVFNIAVDPIAGAEVKIAFTMRNASGIDPDFGNRSSAIVSLDSGATWTEKALGYKLFEDQDEPLVMWAAGSLFVYLRGDDATPDPCPMYGIGSFGEANINLDMDGPKNVALFHQGANAIWICTIYTTPAGNITSVTGGGTWTLLGSESVPDGKMFVYSMVATPADVDPFTGIITGTGTDMAYDFNPFVGFTAIADFATFQGPSPLAGAIAPGIGNDLTTLYFSTGGWFQTNMVLAAGIDVVPAIVGEAAGMAHVKAVDGAPASWDWTWTTATDEFPMWAATLTADCQD